MRLLTYDSTDITEASHAIINIARNGDCHNECHNDGGVSQGEEQPASRG
jgi:hypothetical protein